MKVNASVSLMKECLEEAVVEYVERRRRKARGHKDRTLIDKHAESLSHDVRETLDFQASE